MNKILYSKKCKKIVKKILKSKSDTLNNYDLKKLKLDTTKSNVFKFLIILENHDYLELQFLNDEIDMIFVKRKIHLYNDFYDVYNRHYKKYKISCFSKSILNLASFACVTLIIAYLIKILYYDENKKG